MRVKHKNTGHEGEVLAADTLPEEAVGEQAGDHYRVRFETPTGALTAWVPVYKLEIV